jgi:predicted glycoside hydrolase/deacetylase ChbG (UPF0249 family)
MIRTRFAVFGLIACLTFGSMLRAQDTQPTEIRLIARADDMGVAQGINEACVAAYKEGIVRSAEVIVPGPWFLDAVRLLKDNPDLDAGVHLTLTSEWDNCKWRPLTKALSLSDADGYFPATTKALVSNKIEMDDVEHELRAQIEVARRHLGKQLTHVSAHMGAATATPELKALTDKLAKEYKLRTDDAAKKAPPFGNHTFGPDQRRKSLQSVLEKLEPGDWILVEHPAFDTPETGALGHAGYTNVGADRSNVRRAYMDKTILELVRRRGIKLIGYKDLAPVK